MNLYKKNKKGDQNTVWILISLVLAVAIFAFFLINFNQYGKLLPPNFKEFNGEGGIKAQCEGYVSNGDVGGYLNKLSAFKVPGTEEVIYLEGFNCYFLSKLDENSPIYIQPFPKANIEYNPKIKILEQNINETLRQGNCTDKDNNGNIVKTWTYVYSAQSKKQGTLNSLAITLCNNVLSPVTTKTTPSEQETTPSD